MNGAKAKQIKLMIKMLSAGQSDENIKSAYKKAKKKYKDVMKTKKPPFGGISNHETPKCD